ncbi:DUF5688 family protein [Acetivibrio ethanolgignens]|uniref:Integrase Tn916-type N-terminal DNA binding domain-containing protein n=1 Tax=Acetivibrio ethanolgignens TaxID=290052 RepID=A0A0V8QJ29_9FIRM|nr:DUF5688 family protein [Acetivibrio ethanolgignens]KSV60564.1 hypothetical protein ASU35_05160 [Acetivibrio ethanolgignens]
MASRKDSKGYALRTGESQRKDGRYCFSYQDKRGKRHYRYAKTLVALRDIEKAVRRDMEDGLNPANAARITVNEMYDKYMSQKYGLKPSTRNNYKYCYDHFVRDTFGRKRLVTIKYSDVKELPIMTSCRYSQEIADVICKLKKDNKNIVTFAGKTGVKPVLLIFAPEKIDRVISGFINALETHGLYDNKGVYIPSVDTSELTNYEAMKEKLSIEVISAETNAELLTKIPHESMEDMAVVYRFVLESNDAGRASILVTNDMINHMGVTHEQLKADALENAPEIRPAVIQGMSEVMREMMGPEAFEMFGLPEEQEEMMYVATVPDKNSGAGVLAYQDFMDQAAEKLGGDFYILPSSIHEILLVPDNGDKAADDLRDMVREVNATQVSPEEKLTDNVYHYDSKEHIFELAEKFEARQQEKAETQIDEKSEEHGSVLKDLKDKQKEVVAKPPVKDAAEKAAKAKGGEAL